MIDTKEIAEIIGGKLHEGDVVVHILYYAKQEGVLSNDKLLILRKLTLDLDQMKYEWADWGETVLFKLINNDSDIEEWIDW